VTCPCFQCRFLTLINFLATQFSRSKFASPRAHLPGFLSISRLIFGSARFSFQAQILTLVRCACVPDIDSASCNIVLDFSFGFSREVVGPVLAPCPSRLRLVFCSGITIFFVCRNRFHPSGLRFRSWFCGQVRSSVGFDFLCCPGSVLPLCLCSSVRQNVCKTVSIFHLRVNFCR
jgi:hypothetical protein